jgi:preprotein translocase subunit SecD
MKIIAYKIMAMVFVGILAMGFINRPQTKKSILIQSNDSKISSLTLSQSADIITKRLQSFTKEKFEIKTIPGKNQINVILPENVDLKIVEDLITQKGALEFYEAYSYGDLTQLLNGDSSLVKLFHSSTPNESSPTIGCIAIAEIYTVNQYLNSVGSNGKYKFAWSNYFDKPEVCLYALRTEAANLIPLTGLDIKSFEAKHDSERNTDNIDFKFKPSAVKVWADVTRRNIDRAIAIVMDNHVLYSPVVRDEISGGNCTISGDFTKTQVQYIVAIGSNGELPAGFSIVK